MSYLNIDVFYRNHTKVVHWWWTKLQSYRFTGIQIHSWMTYFNWKHPNTNTFLQQIYIKIRDKDFMWVRGLGTFPRHFICEIVL